MSDIFKELNPLARGLDVAALRHKIIAGNMANMNTPGYVRYDVKFEEFLREELSGSNDPQRLNQALKEIDAKVVLDRSGPFKPDGNNVTFEKEQGQITRNKILHDAFSEILSMKLRQLRQVITRNAR